MSVDLDASWESLESLAPEWERLEASSLNCGLFLSTTWHRASAVACCGSPENHAVLAVRRGNDLVAIAPVHETEGGVTFSLDFNLTDYQDLLTAPQEERAAWESVLAFGQASRWTRIELVGIREDSATVPVLGELFGKNGWQETRTNWDVSPYLCLPSSWDEYLQGLGKKDRHELRRKFRRLEGSGAVRYEVFDRWTDETANAMESFLDLMGKSGDDKAMFLTDERRAFMNTMSQITADAGALRLCFLEIDGVRTSATMSFADGDRWLLYNSGYDPEYRQQSVGVLLKAWTIRYAIENGFREYDFLRGAEPYKYDLGGQDRKLYRYVLER
jgi:CelD/BcsL family acetyltransferase involved in cellulose biosynthesis